MVEKKWRGDLQKAVVKETWGSSLKRKFNGNIIVTHNDACPFNRT